MRRTGVIYLLTLLLLSGGTACLLLGHCAARPGLGHSPALDVGGELLFLAAAIVGLGGCLSLSRATRKLTRQLGQAGPGPLGRAHADLVPLVEALNELSSKAEDRVSRAAMHAKELEIQLKVATAERQHAEAIIYSISDAVMVTDRFDELVLANDSAARAFDFDLGKSERSPIDKVLRDVQMIGLIREMRQSRSKGGRRIVEHKLATPQGDRTYKVTLSCVAPQNDQPAGVVAVLHDMTREKEVAQMKNDFVSNVSHELRTPLASIKAYIEMLIDGEATDERTKLEFYEVIHNEANRLSRLIDNILSISRIESGLVKINKKPQSLMVLAKEAIEVISPQARQKDIRLMEDLTPACYQVLIDKDMLYEAVLNLLSNAIKYTPEGGQVTVQTVVNDGQKTAITRITDSGVGIPQKDLPFVFDKFYRSEANNRMAKGTGLGLSLVKHVIETVHHGRLFVESHVGKGSTFGFELPLVE